MEWRIKEMVTPVNDPYGLAMWVVLAFLIIYAVVIRYVTKLFTLKLYTSTRFIEFRQALRSKLHLVAK